MADKDLHIHEKKNTWLSIGAAILAGLSTTLMATMAKLGGERGESVPIMVLWRSIWALFFLIPIITFAPPKITLLAKVRTQRFGFHLFRATVGFCGIYIFFYSLKDLTLATTTTLVYTVPFFMPFVAYLWARVPLPRWSWIGIIVGFIGVVFVVKPGHHLFQPIALLTLSVGVISAIGQYASHLLARTESSRTINFYFFIVTGVLGGLITLIHPVKNWAHLGPTDYLIFLGLGVFGFSYVFTLTYAMARGVPNLVTVFLYTSVIFAIGLDYWVWGTVVDLFTLIGICLVILGVILKLVLHRREHR